MLAKLYLERAELESAAKSCAIVLAVNPRDEEVLALEARVAERGGPVGRERGEPDARQDRKTAAAANDAMGPRRKADSQLPGSAPAAPAGTRKRSAQPSKQLTRLQNLLETIRERRSDD
jgi:hypothetical protein